VLTKNEVCILINIVIVNPTQENLFCQFCITQGFIASKAIQAKEKSYHNQHPTNHFLPLIIEVFGCLDKQVDVFLHGCANANWDFKRPKGLPFSVLVTFLPKKNFNYITKDISILHLKPGNSDRSNYFPTSTPSKHTPHHHD